LLVLGGTRFLGRAVIEEAIGRGYVVTMFNRGLHGRELFPDVERLSGDRKTDLTALEGRNWDAVIDTSGYWPSSARLTADVLARHVHHYTFISTIAVYMGIENDAWTEQLEVRAADAADEARADDVEVGEIAGQSFGHLYGPLKASFERIIQQRFDRALVVRPGLIIGPWDFGGDRFTYWPRRVREGGEVLAPGRRHAPLQVIDVRDVAHWILAMIEQDGAGTYNAVGPAEPITMTTLLETCRAVAESDATFTWVDDDFLIGSGVTARELPLWAPGGARDAQNTTSNARALADGLSFRPLANTIADTLLWELDHPQEVSFPRERERQLLVNWHRRSAE
jgi:2'-hydroxyisoflavone reductase